MAAAATTTTPTRARTTREDRDGSAQAQAEPGAQAVEQADAEPGGSAAPAPPRVSGEFRIARQEPITLDPALVTDATSASYVVELFSGLVTLDQDLNIVPDLAEALPEVIDNPDGTVTYRFVLRRDALFHNNRRVTADDVKWSLERNASPDTFSPTAQDYLGDIVGARDYIRGRIDVITGVEVIDERTIDITVDAPKEYFLAKLTYPTAFVVDRQQVEADPQNWARNPNGTGPFRVQEWQLASRWSWSPLTATTWAPPPSVRCASASRAAPSPSMRTTRSTSPASASTISNASATPPTPSTRSSSTARSSRSLTSASTCASPPSTIPWYVRPSAWRWTS